MTYTFNSKVAEIYGVNEAIFIQNIHFWIIKNIANNRHFHNGRYWTYNSTEAFSELFPFWSKHQVVRIINKLVELEVLFKDNFNKNTFDRTSWYALSDEIFSIYNGENIKEIKEEVSCEKEEDIEQKPDDKSTTSILRNTELHLAESPNGYSGIATPIPYINTDVTTDRKQDLEKNCGDAAVARVREKIKKPENQIQAEGLFAEHFNRQGNSFEINYISRQLEHHDYETVKMAFLSACAANLLTLNYLRGIFKNYRARKIKTIEDCADYDYRSGRLSPSGGDVGMTYRKIQFAKTGKG